MYCRNLNTLKELSHFIDIGPIEDSENCKNIL